MLGKQYEVLNFEVFERCPAELPGGDGLTIPRCRACFSGKTAGCGLDRLRIRRCGCDHARGNLDFLGPAGLDEPLRLGHEGVIGTWRAPGRRCAHDAGGMPVTSVTGRRRELVEPLRDGGAIGRSDRFPGPVFPSEIAYVVENGKSKNENSYAL